MAEHYLQEVFNKVPAPKEVKALVKGVFDKLVAKTLEYVKEKYIDQAHNRKKGIKKLDKKLNEVNSSRYVPISQVREDNFNEFIQKEEETKGFVKKLRKEQKEREMRLRERE